MIPDKIEHYIGGRQVPSANGATFGVKASGLGREGGQHSIDFYTQARVVHVALGDTRVPRFGA